MYAIASGNADIGRILEWITASYLESPNFWKLAYVSNDNVTNILLEY